MKKKAEKQPYLYLRLIEMLLGILITAIGLSCMMKSQLGQTAITAFTQNLTAITGIKSGTVLIIFFISCTGAQIVILKKQFANIQYLQIPLALLQGKIVNLICYDVPGLCDWYPKPISENGCVSFQVYSSVPMVWLYYFMPILLKIHLRNWLWSYPDGCGWNFVYFEPE